MLRSPAEHLTSLQYQMDKDKARLAEIQKIIEAEKLKYEPAHDVYLNAKEVEAIGQKTLTGKISMPKEDFAKITSLAKEGITSRGEITRLKNSVEYYSDRYYRASNALDRIENLYSELKEKCKPFIAAMEHFPDLVKIFLDKVKQLFTVKEERERQEKAARDTAQKQKYKSNKSRGDWSR